MPSAASARPAGMRRDPSARRRRPARGRLLSVAAVTLIASVAAATARAQPRSPTPAQIHRAVVAATHSRHLWATLTTCGVHHDRTVGIRGEMPALPFDAHLLMVVTVFEFSPTAHRYLPLAEHWKLGGRLAAHGVLIQDGLSLRFGGPLTLTAKIRFEWFRGRRLLAATSRPSRGGHPTSVSRPRGFSAGACSLR